MKFLVLAFCTAMFVFALASAWSDMLQPQVAALALKSAPPRPAAPAVQTSKRFTQPVVESFETDELPAPARVAAHSLRQQNAPRAKPILEAELPDDDAESLSSHLAEVKLREARLVARQETLRLICDDIHEELALVDETRRQSDEALMAAEQRAVPAVHRESKVDGNRQPARSRQASTEWNSDETPKPVTDSSAVRMAVLLIRRLVSQGSFDMATSLLSRMKQREAAKVLAAIDRDDPQLAARLLTSLSEAGEPNRQE